jgi:pterin-4a-carbinolamine dehydratase
VEVTYPRVRVHVVSHDAGGLTRKDAEVASPGVVEISTRLSAS